jgi:hypothetical protein
LSSENKSYDYNNQSRGHKTKGASYKERYVNDVVCPNPICGHNKAYKDTWTTRIVYTCMKRDCRTKWYVALTQEEIQANNAAKEQAALLEKENNQEMEG